jgi:hypothetical protein
VPSGGNGRHLSLTAKVGLGETLKGLTLMATYTWGGGDIVRLMSKASVRVAEGRDVPGHLLAGRKCQEECAGRTWMFGCRYGIEK